jgi:hypothetical protein
MLITLLALCHVPFAEPVRDRVDGIERNVMYDLDGRLVFQQLIFSDYDGAAFRVVAWRLDKGEFLFTENPPAVIWVDENRLRHVTAKSWRATWTQHDPETEQRDFLPVAERRGLSR